ncbi:MAG: Respiratory nitrate reductase 1 beta chain [Candidatus Omnitrophica bacterium]|nr:Respiratory nitrate reductase 1 beta chain [Candidatus Omnitrophota bacterium]
MDIRAHLSMVFHLDKCIGCHTCSVACKNIWTDRPGAEYMWWNNVETKPGTGYPTLWEDQLNYKGGWMLGADRKLRLRSQDKKDFLPKLFYNPNQPGLDDYYEPWTYKYQDLFDAAAGDDQPTAIPVSKITGEPMEIRSGPNWDDDLSGSPIYGENDPNLKALTPEERQMMFEIERISMMYLPRICNHCANPSCVASCPSGALYKRGEDGIVLVNQDKCRGWRACVTACPYKKIYYNWKTGKSEKCILCYPRVETGQAPACFHTCVGRIRYMGVLLYDAERIEEAMKAPEEGLVEAQRSVLLDPHDPRIVARALDAGIPPGWIGSAQRSPVWKYVSEWKLALPLHPEFRTMPMLYYVPPLLPVMGRQESEVYGHDTGELFASIDKARLPIRYLASLFSAGDPGPVRDALRRLLAVRIFQRSSTLGDIAPEQASKVLREAGLTEDQARQIYTLTALPGPEDRFMMPPVQREESIENTCAPDQCKGGCGLGPTQVPERGL